MVFGKQCWPVSPGLKPFRSAFLVSRLSDQLFQYFSLTGFQHSYQICFSTFQLFRLPTFQLFVFSSLQPFRFPAFQFLHFKLFGFSSFQFKFCFSSSRLFSFSSFQLFGFQLPPVPSFSVFQHNPALFCFSAFQLFCFSVLVYASCYCRAEPNITNL